MKVSCEVIKDLLPLYMDDVCSDESRQLVMEHLAECVGCRLEMEEMRSELPVDTQTQNLRDAQAVKNLSKKWKRSMLKAFAKGVVIALIVAVAIAFLLLFIADSRLFQY